MTSHHQTSAGLARSARVWPDLSPRSKEALVYALSASELATIDVLLDKTRHLPPQQVTRRDFSHPAISPMLATVKDIVMARRGVVIIQGIKPDRYSVEDFERIYWGFGTHWGKAAVQSVSGDRLGHVRHEADNPKNRGYMALRELKFHSDAYELVGLMCVQTAAEGGYSRLASAMIIHDEILALRPDLIEPLYRGFPYAMAEAQASSTPVTSSSIPVFSKVKGQLSCMYCKAYMRTAAEYLGIPLPPKLTEALLYFEQIAERPDIHLQFMLEEGEIMLFNNYTFVHSRTNFKNSEDKKRHMLRLWLSVRAGRPVVPVLRERGLAYERLYENSLRQSMS
jgi:hypothetical protein